MHDNARPHVARICRHFLNRNNVNVLPWPAVSPDMNPIEHICEYLGRKVRARGNMKKFLKNLHLRNRWSDFEIILQESGFDISGRPDCPIRAVIATGKLPSPFVSTPGKKKFWSIIVYSGLYRRYRYL